MSIFEEIFEVSRRIEHERTPDSVFNHLTSEVEELDEEISKYYNGQKPGVDGILGEAVDVILCAIDLAFQENTHITAEEVENTIRRKLAKWERVYGQ